MRTPFTIRKTLLYTGCMYLFMNMLTSCYKSDSSGAANTDSTLTSFSQVFDRFWNGLNTNYVYWDTDTTNWDAVYDKYKPLFTQLDINNKTDIQKSVLYFRQMTYGLVDNHFEILFTKPELAGQLIFPSSQRKQVSPGYHASYDYTTTDRKYFDAGYMLATDNTTDSGSTPLQITLATINRNILYFRCNRFSLLKSYQSKPNNKVHAILDSLFSLLNASSIKGAIIDVRNNYGGNLTDLNFLAGHFIDQPLHLGYSSYKSNTGRLDFTPWIEAYVTPQPGSRGITYPVIALTDHFTVSLAELLAMTIHTLPNGKVVGETTWGATGPLAANDIYNDGQFKIPGFMTVYTSSARFKYVNNEVYENIGFPPDISVPFNLQEINAGKDGQLEKAIQTIQ